MESSSQEPQNLPVESPTGAPEPSPLKPKRSKKPLIISLVSLIVIVVASCAGWYWWSLQQPVDTVVSDTPKSSQQQKLPEPNTVAYSYNTTNLQGPSDLLWRLADGGEKQTTPSKAFVGRAEVLGNQVLIETYYNEAAKAAPSILYSKDGGKTYETVFTGKAPATSTDMDDQITGITFASDGKSVLFGLLPHPAGQNTVKQVFFDKPDQTTDILTTEAAGVFPIAFNAKTNMFYFSEGCYNCDGNGASTSVFAYDTAKKQRSTLIDGADKHLGMTANKAATKLVITTPTVDKNSTHNQDGFYGYYVGAPYTVSVFDLKTGKPDETSTNVGSDADNSYVRTGFMTDDVTPYYYKDKQLFSFSNDTASLLYEAGQPIHQVFYVSKTTVFASTGTYENFVLNRFGIKTQDTEQILTGDDTSTRIFGITEQ